MFFKRFISASAVAVLLISAFPLASSAEETDTDTVYINKHTPVIDGTIDPEYYSSFHVEHYFPRSDSPDQYLSSGKFSFYETDENGFHVIGEDKNPVYKGYTEYNFDCKASSYYLWDDDNLYVAVKVTDDDYGCVSNDRVKYAMEEEIYSYPIFQDAVLVSLSCLQYDNKFQNIAAERACRIMTSGISDYVGGSSYLWQTDTNDDNSLFNIKSKKEYEDNSKYFAASESDDGYIIEMQLPVNKSKQEELWKSGCELHSILTVTDSPKNARYADQLNLYEETGPFDGQGGMFIDYIMLQDKQASKLKLIDEIKQNDINLDGEVNAKDLVRLMKYIADNSAVMPQDINADGKLSSKDLVAFMKIIAEN